MSDPLQSQPAKKSIKAHKSVQVVTAGTKESAVPAENLNVIALNYIRQWKRANKQ